MSARTSLILIFSPVRLRLQAHREWAVLIVMFVVLFLRVNLHAAENENRNQVAPTPSSEPSNTAKPVPLGEWYEVGHRIGSISKLTFSELGHDAGDERAQLISILALTAGEPVDVTPEPFELCFQGFRDGLGGIAAKFTPAADQKSSLLPAKLQRLSRFVGHDSSGALTAKNPALQNVLDATVMIKVEIAQGHAHGSGFFIAPGLILTNKHVIEEASKIEVKLTDKKVVKGTVHAVHPKFDIAIVQIDLKQHPIVKIGDATKIAIGEQVVAVGYPKADFLTVTVTFGRISATDRFFDGNPCFHLDLTINHGNSGGPLVTENGEAIGINTFGLAALEIDRFNFAIRLDALVSFFKENCKGFSP